MFSLAPPLAFMPISLYYLYCLFITRYCLQSYNKTSEMQKKISLFFLHFRVQESSAEPELRNILQIFVNERQKKDRQQVLVSAVSLLFVGRFACPLELWSLATEGTQETPCGSKFFILHSSFSEGSVAHAAGGAQCRDDGGDDAADNLEDGLPRFLVVFHGIRCF